MDWKKLVRLLLFPPVWLMLLLTAISAAALTGVFLKGMEQTVIAYAVYVLAFYTLSVITCFCVMMLPKRYGQVKAKIYGNPFGNRYLTDRLFRAKISLYLSLGASLLYVVINLWSWYLVHSWWFVLLAGYDLLMAVMRFLLVRYVQTHTLGVSLSGEWKLSRSCACILLLINLSLSGAVLMILYQNRGYDYPGILIYVMALYSFYTLTHAIVGLAKHRSLGSPVMSTAKTVSLSAALVSMLNLETAMFAQFGGDMPQQDQNLMIILTGAGISVAVVSLSVLLIIRATLEIRRIKNGK